MHQTTTATRPKPIATPTPIFIAVRSETSTGPEKAEGPGRALAPSQTTSRIEDRSRPRRDEPPDSLGSEAWWRSGAEACRETDAGSPVQAGDGGHYLQEPFRDPFLADQPCFLCLRNERLDALAGRDVGVAR